VERKKQRERDRKKGGRVGGEGAKNRKGEKEGNKTRGLFGHRDLEIELELELVSVSVSVSVSV